MEKLWNSSVVWFTHKLPTTVKKVLSKSTVTNNHYDLPVTMSKLLNSPNSTVSIEASVIKMEQPAEQEDNETFEHSSPKSADSSLSKKQSPMSEIRNSGIIRSESRKTINNFLVKAKSRLVFSEPDDGADSKIVKEIVMEKFESTLSGYFQRLTSRRSLKTWDRDNSDGSLYKYEGTTTPKSNHSSNYCLNSEEIEDNQQQKDNYDECYLKQDTTTKSSHSSNYCLNSEKMEDNQQQKDNCGELSLKQDTYLNVDEQSKNNVDIFNSNEFLTAALGNDMQLCESSPVSTTKRSASVSMSQISALVSVSECDNSLIASNGNRRLEETLTSEYDYGTYEELLYDLSMKRKVQDEKISQMSKILRLCENTKEFTGSLEHVEAERLLLLAIRQREAILHKIRQLDQEEDYQFPEHKGIVTLTHLHFPLKSSEDNFERRSDHTLWLVSLLECGLTVLASQVTRASPTDDAIEFKDRFEFDNLSADFEIDVSLYYLSMKNNLRTYSHESKFHLKKKTICMSPKTIFDFLHKESIRDLRNPSHFKRWGQTTVKIADLTRPKTCESFNQSLGLREGEHISMDLSSAVVIAQKYSNFLTIGGETGKCVSWNRRWCTLDGFVLKYWSYPSDEFISEPIGEIDMRWCASSQIAPAERSLCARPRTLFLQIIRLRSDELSTVKYFLSSDSSKEMTIWETHLNSVLTALRNWNKMKCEVFLEKF